MNKRLLTIVNAGYMLLVVAAALLLFPIVTGAQTSTAPESDEVVQNVNAVETAEEAAALNKADKLAAATLTDAEVEEIADEKVTEVLTAQMLEEQLTQVYIRPYSYVKENDGTLTMIPIAAQADGTYLLRKRHIVGLQPVNWLAQPIIEDHIEFSGVTEPHAVVTLVVRANPMVVEDTIADRRGRWSIALGVNTLPAGDHSAYVQASTESIHSDEVRVAEFYVEASEQVSNATWVLVIAVGLLLIIVLVVVNVQFYLHRRKLSRYSAPAVAKADPDTHVEMDSEVIESVTEVAELE